MGRYLAVTLRGIFTWSGVDALARKDRLTLFLYLHLKNRPIFGMKLMLRTSCGRIFLPKYTTEKD